MKIVAALLLLLAPCATVAGTMPADDAPIRDAMTKMYQAADDGDADRFMDWYAHSPALIVTFDGQSMRGWQPNLEQQRRWWSNKPPSVVYTDEHQPEITLQSPDVATSLQWLLVGDPHSAGKPRRLVITSVRKKLPEGWRIIVAHKSLVQ